MTEQDLLERIKELEESYSYVTEVGDGVEQIIAGLIKDIIQIGRAHV